MISANAFLVDSTARDAIYVPVLPLDGFDMANIGTTGFEVTSAINGIWPGSIVDILYWIDPTYQATTAIKLWSVCDMSNDQWNVTNSSGAAYPLTIYNADEGEKSLNIYFKNAELNTIDPSTLHGRPTNFVDGFIRFTVPNPSHAVHPDGSIGTCQSIASNAIGSIRTNGSFYPRYNFMLIFSYVDSSLIGAAQTMLGTFRWEFLP